MLSSQRVEKWRTADIKDFVKKCIMTLSSLLKVSCVSWPKVWNRLWRAMFIFDIKSKEPMFCLGTGKTHHHCRSRNWRRSSEVGLWQLVYDWRSFSLAKLLELFKVILNLQIFCKWRVYNVVKRLLILQVLIFTMKGKKSKLAIVPCSNLLLGKFKRRKSLGCLLQCLGNLAVNAYTSMFGNDLCGSLVIRPNLCVFC